MAIILKYITVHSAILMLIWGVLYISSGSVDIVNTLINNVNSKYLISISKNTILKMSNSVVDGNNLENSIFYLETDLL